MNDGDCLNCDRDKSFSSTVVLRDILQRNYQADQGMLFLCSNIGSITSPNSIGSVLSSEGEIQGRKGKNVAGLP